MKLRIRRLVGAIVFFLTAAIVLGLWRLRMDGAVGSLPDLAMNALAMTLGYKVGDLLLSRFRPHSRARTRYRPVAVWALGMGGCGAIAFAASGFANGAEWTILQWMLVAVWGGMIGFAGGALWASLGNAQHRRFARVTE